MSDKAVSETEKEFGRLRLSVQGTNNGRGFDIFYDFGESFDFVEGKTKSEFYFIQPWMQFPHARYTEECMLVSIELVRRFNEFKALEQQLRSAEDQICTLNKRLEKAANNHYKLVEALEAIKKHQETVMRGKYELSATWQIANKALAEVKP